MKLVCPLIGVEWEGEFPEELLEHAQNIPSPQAVNTLSNFTIMQHLHKIQESLRILHQGKIE